MIPMYNDTYLPMHVYSYRYYAYTTSDFISEWPWVWIFMLNMYVLCFRKSWIRIAPSEGSNTARASLRRRFELRQTQLGRRRRGWKKYWESWRKKMKCTPEINGDWSQEKLPKKRNVLWCNKHTYGLRKPGYSKSILLSSFILFLDTGQHIHFIPIYIYT